MKSALTGLYCRGLILLALFAGPARARSPRSNSRPGALPALAVEESYDFLRQHAEGLPPRPRDPDARPRADEVEIGAGWRSTSPPAPRCRWSRPREELQRYLKDAMRGAGSR